MTVDAQNGGLETKMWPWSVCRPLIADSHHFDEEQESGPHKSANSDPDPHESDADLVLAVMNGRLEDRNDCK
jgi:hypothetical protein